MLFEDRIQKFEYKLNDTDDQIIEYILKNKQEVVKLSIQRLAANLYTVPNSIIRLSKKLGYDGYSQLKNSLKEEVNEAKEAKEESLQFNIKRTFSLIDIEKIAIVVKMLYEAKRVLFFGVGDTALFCEMMVKNLKIAGKQSDFYIHRHEAIYGINELEKDDVLFLLSLSGETEQVLEMAELGKSKKIKIITLTHFNRNSLQKLGDVNLYCYAPKQMLKGHNVTDKTPLMIIVRTLSEYYWNLTE
ncbi:MurR/RpiR family transcriptional regulator [Priestia megaterium]